ncbi:hypothetical protein GA0074695_0144 [Micromonospora viridifaciens]|uniref:Uncharacterized protein n=1 Tax=Micromonospora viridifaciens TaxID=1881 RepID=A0A1C4U4A3_MICVI|nr:hypothetical protein [Micromonospora viridifaciens]SCE66474.1 hypothetical protein GA0074695_0144 [Micromonospora viridifaciens]
MSFVPPPRTSRHWTFTAVATAVATPALVWGVDRSYRSTERCLQAHGSSISDSEAEIPDACSEISALLALLILVATAYAAATAITGLCVGVAEGRRRRGFGHRRWFTVTIVGVAAPWALATYAAGYGIGRLLQPPAVDPSWADGRDAARRTLEFLAKGGQPGTVPTPGFLTEEPVHLDARLHYARHYGTVVTYHQTSALAFGSAAFVTGALLANAVGNSNARSRAERLARPQWRDHELTRVVLTPTRTWCYSFGRWLSFDHAAVMEYHLDPHGVVLLFADTEPLRLTGPAAWLHAVLFAYFRFGVPALTTAAFLVPIRATHSAQQPATAAATSRE